MRLLFLHVVLGFLLAPMVVAATPEQIDQSIAKAVQFLYKQQKNGSWEIVDKRQNLEPGRVAGSQWGGLSATATYALLAAGQSPQEEKLKQAIKFQIQADIVGTYALGMRTQIWPLIPSTKETREAVARDAELLRKAMKLDGDSRGMYGYFPEGAGGFYDHSASQFAVLGMWACSQTNIEVPDQYWRIVEDAWRRHQYPDGSWSYQYKAQGKDGQPTISMTAAGIATLFITKEMLNSSAGLNCSPVPRDAQIDRGMQWLGDKLGNRLDASLEKEPWAFYTLYGLSRIGVAGGYKYIGAVNWFDVGADYLVRNQAPDGSWNNGYEGGSTYCTAFALLFLSRGRAPVLINKLEYAGPDAKTPSNWNQRPRDVAGLTQWIAKQTERPANWQIVNLNAPVDELFDARILYLSGDKPFTFNDTELAKLKQFIEGGGLLLGNANCNSPAFTNSFRKLGSALFPQYEFRELPADHILYTGQQYPRSKWKTPPSVLGLSNGARELLLLLPTGDAGKSWQTRNDAMRPEFHQLAMNLALYVSDQQEFGHKGQTHFVHRDNNVQGQKTTKVARLQYTGNWDPEPGGWRRLGAITHNRFRQDIETTPIPLGEGKLTSEFKAAHLTGTGAIEFNDAQRKELKSYVESGGTLIIDACGGSSEFRTSAEKLLTAIFPDQASQLSKPLAGDHPHFNVRAERNAVVGYRRIAQKALGQVKLPQLRGIQLGNRVAVFLSYEDLSTGLVGQPVDGIVGYDPASAVDCMASMVLYAGSR